MRKFRMRRPSGSMAIAFVALLAALAGTAVALPGKNTVKSDDIKNGQVKRADIASNAVTSGKVKNDSLTGSDIKESSLATVPNASAAGSANNANTANRAGELTGRKIAFRAPAGTSNTVVLDVGGLKLTASCSPGGGTLSVIAESGVDNSYIEFAGFKVGSNAVTNDDGSSDADAGATFNILPDSQFFVMGMVTFGTPGGSVVTVNYQAHTDQPPGENNCVFQGTALQG